MECALAQLSSIVPVPPFVPTPTNLRNRRAVAQLDAILYRIIRERRAAGDDRGDLLSMLLATQDEDGGSMTDRQTRDEAMTLFLAGHETTANALSWALYLLAKNPEARARVEAEVDALGRVPSYDDLKLLPWTLAVLKETLRLYPPAYILARRVTEDVVIGRHLIKKHTIVLVNVLGIHRRTDLFPRPESFEPERFIDEAEKAFPRCGPAHLHRKSLRADGRSGGARDAPPALASRSRERGAHPGRASDHAAPSRRRPHARHGP